MESNDDAMSHQYLLIESCQKKEAEILLMKYFIDSLFLILIGALIISMQAEFGFLEAAA